MGEKIEVIAIIEGLKICYYLLKLKEKPKVSTCYRFCLFLTHNPKVVGSNPAPATNEIKGLDEKSNPFLFWLFWIFQPYFQPLRQNLQSMQVKRMVPRRDLLHRFYSE